MRNVLLVLDYLNFGGSALPADSQNKLPLWATSFRRYPDTTYVFLLGGGLTKACLLQVTVKRDFQEQFPNSPCEYLSKVQVKAIEATMMDDLQW